MFFSWETTASKTTNEQHGQFQQKLNIIVVWFIAELLYETLLILAGCI